MRNRVVGVGLIGNALLFSGMAAYFLVFALYLQQGRGLSPLECGAVFTVTAAMYMVGTRRAAALLGRYGARATISSSALFFGAGHLLLLAAVEHIGTDGSVLWLVPGLAVSGLGMGVALSGLVGIIMASVEPRHAGTVSGTSSTVQQVGNAVGVALVGIVFFGRVDQGMVDAFGASLIYLVATTVGVAVAAAFLPGRPRAVRPEDQSVKLASSSSAAA
jgi:MFS family permease